MRKFVAIVVSLFLISISSGFSLPAESSGYVTYRDGPRKSGVALDARELKWLNQVFGLMKTSDFTFIFRKDRDHWIGLYREGKVMSVQMHDETAGFDARATVNQTTGALDLEKGVLLKGLSENESMIVSAKELKSYLVRALEDKGGVFGQMKTDKMVSEPMVKKEAEVQMSETKMVEKPKAEMKSEKAGISQWKSDQMIKLKEGNSRFVSGKLLNTDRDTKKRNELSKGQAPFSIVVSCSDSRVGPEVIFDQGLGNLFVVRTAGEVVDKFELGSIEYAAEHLKARHILVLAHSECGAVKAAVGGGDFSENIASIVDFIEPSVAKAKESHESDILDASIRENARQVVKTILKSEVIEELMKQGLVIDIGIYDLATGKVTRVDW